ncbi:hypothetical protein GCM10009594_03300 [Kocuria palustris]
MAVVELNPEHCVRERFDHAAFDLDDSVFLSHVLRSLQCPLPKETGGVRLSVCRSLLLPVPRTTADARGRDRCGAMSGHAEGYADNQQKTLRYCGPVDKMVRGLLRPQEG